MAKTESRETAAGRAGLDTILDSSGRLASAHAALAAEARAADARLGKLRDQVERARTAAAAKLAARKKHWAEQAAELNRTVGAAHYRAAQELDSLLEKVARARDTLA